MPSKKSNRILKSYSKINLGLKIIRKRSDGFHDIETIFYPVNLYDNISIEVNLSEKSTNSVHISSNKSFIPTDKKNLCYKAIEAFFVGFGIKNYYEMKIHIEKNVPVGGGLGGGSANAASIFSFLLDYFDIDKKADTDKIRQITTSIGSDVPFFLVMKPCFASGRGEVIRVLDDFNFNYSILLVNPNIHVSTKWAFESLEYKEGEEYPSHLGEMQRFDLANKEYFENDFESAVFPRYPEIRDIKEKMLECGAEFASMSGSGATVYGLFGQQEKDKMNDCKNFFASKNYYTFIPEKSEVT